MFSKKSCKEDVFMPYIEYMNRVYSNKPHVHNEVQDWGQEGSKLNERLENVVSGGARSETVLIDPYTVHAFFDRIEHSLPEYVSSTPAMVAGGFVGLLVFKESYKLGLKEYVQTYSSVYKTDSRLWEESILLATEKGYKKGGFTHMEHAVKNYLGEGGSFERDTKPKQTNPSLQTAADIISGGKEILLDATNAGAMNDLTLDSVKLAQRLLNERWKLIILVGGIVSALIAKFVFDKVYLVLLMRRCRNRSHFAASKFLSLYASALSLKQSIKIP